MSLLSAKGEEDLIVPLQIFSTFWLFQRTNYQDLDAVVSPKQRLLSMLEVRQAVNNHNIRRL